MSCCLHLLPSIQQNCGKTTLEKFVTDYYLQLNSKKSPFQFNFYVAPPLYFTITVSLNGKLNIEFITFIAISFLWKSTNSNKYSQKLITKFCASAFILSQHCFHISFILFSFTSIIINFCLSGDRFKASKRS